MQLIEEKRLIKTMLSLKPSVNAFVMATVSVLLMTLTTLFYWRNDFDLASYLPAGQVEVFQQGQYWRLLTAIFIHADLAHLLSNMYMLWIFGFFVFGYFGFAIYPWISLLLAALVNGAAVATYAPEVHLLGASGLVYILGGFWLTLYFLIQRQYSVLSRLMRVTGISLVIFTPSTFVATTSYRTHAFGFAAGLLAALYYFYKNLHRIRSYEVYKTTLVEDIINS